MDAPDPETSDTAEMKARNHAVKSVLLEHEDRLQQSCPLPPVISGYPPFPPAIEGTR